MERSFIFSFCGGNVIGRVNSLYRTYHGVANEDHDRNRIYDIVRLH